MKLEQLRYLQDIEQTKSLSKTSSRFYISPQALSKSMQQLENEVGVSLLIRSPSGMTLTNEGKRFINELSPLIDKYDLLKEGFQKSHALENEPDRLPEIRIGISSVLAGVLLPKTLAAFNQRHPNQILTIEEISCDEAFPSLREGRFDMVFLSLNSTMFDRAWNLFGKNNHHYTLLLSDRLAACVSSSSPLAKKELLSLDDLFSTNRTSLGINDTPRGQAIKESLGFDNGDESMYKGNNLDLHREAMKQIGAVTIMPRFLFQKAFSGKQFVAKYVENMNYEMYHTVIYASPEPHPHLREIVNILQSLI